VTERPPRGEPLVGESRRASKPRAIAARARECSRRGAKPHKSWSASRGAGRLTHSRLFSKEGGRRTAPRTKASPRSSRLPPSRVAAGQGRGRRGAPPRGGAGNTSRRGGRRSRQALTRLRAGLATGVLALRESAGEQGRCLTVDVNGSIGRTRRRTVGSRPHGQSGNLANTCGQVARFRGARGTGSSRPRSSSRRPDPRCGWRTL